ncbi:hypothetical protein [Prosthecobacter dejongeii]|uniref:DUF3486 family protein n=1 Tax=Prosthecobacter dejongeii TaxID=48465 RepID=A0A7W8DP59_9BACT|nr:hypothetical protein [Prosthecobacter dejongeii]MBB5037098.1 hypothetical protein [Prosthecobacter dejongeii]
MSDPLPKTPKGKLARLPAKLREAVCRRIHDGETAGQILPWLNALPEVIKACETHFEGELITPQNLSAWRMGGYQVWLSQRDEIEATRDRARYSLELAKASGGNLSEGALAQVTGEVMELMEEITAVRKAGGEIDPKALVAINKILVAARSRELDTLTHQLNLKKLEQKDRELALAEDKFQIQFVEAFLKHLDDKKAREIAESGVHKDIKMDQLRLHLFGRRPERQEGPP